MCKRDKSQLTLPTFTWVKVQFRFLSNLCFLFPHTTLRRSISNLYVFYASPIRLTFLFTVTEGKKRLPNTERQTNNRRVAARTKSASQKNQTRLVAFFLRLPQQLFSAPPRTRRPKRVSGRTAI